MTNTTPEQTELLACPFCGLQTQIQAEDGVIACSTPDCAIGHFWINTDKWNARAAQPQVQESGKPTECPNYEECSSSKNFGVGCFRDDSSNAAGGTPWQECHCGIAPPALREAPAHNKNDLHNDLRQVYGNTITAWVDHLWALGYRKASQPPAVQGDIETYSKDQWWYQELVKAAELPSASPDLKRAVLGVLPKLIQQYAAVQGVPAGWISVQNQLPPPMTRVFAHLPNARGAMITREYYVGVSPRECVDDDRIAHWMPLPAAPQPTGEQG